MRKVEEHLRKERKDLSAILRVEEKVLKERNESANKTKQKKKKKKSIQSKESKVMCSLSSSLLYLCLSLCLCTFLRLLSLFLSIALSSSIVSPCLVYRNSLRLCMRSLCLSHLTSRLRVRLAAESAVQCPVAPQRRS